MRIQNGFTLIELMIVIAIVSLLAAVAIPSYLSYIGKSQVTEGITITSGLRSEITSYVWENKRFPDSAAVAITGNIGQQASVLDGKYVAQNSIIVAANTGVITIGFDAGSIAGKTLTLTPRINTLSNQQIIEWTCGGTIIPDRLPSACKI